MRPTTSAMFEATVYRGAPIPKPMTTHVHVATSSQHLVFCRGAWVSRRSPPASHTQALIAKQPCAPLGRRRILGSVHCPASPLKPPRRRSALHATAHADSQAQPRGIFDEVHHRLRLVSGNKDDTQATTWARGMRAALMRFADAEAALEAALLNFPGQVKGRARAARDALVVIGNMCQADRIPAQLRDLLAQDGCFDAFVMATRWQRAELYQLLAQPVKPDVLPPAPSPLITKLRDMVAQLVDAHRPPVVTRWLHDVKDQIDTYEKSEKAYSERPEGVDRLAVLVSDAQTLEQLLQPPTSDASVIERSVVDNWTKQRTNEPFVTLVNTCRYLLTLRVRELLKSWNISAG